jgi:uncharacterized membrane protein
MEMKTFKIWGTIIRYIMYAVVTASVLLGNWIITAVGGGIGMVVLILLRVRVKGVVIDERIRTITREAAYFTYSVGTFIAFIAGLVLVFVHHDNLKSTEAVIGYTLIFANFTLYIINDLAYYYHSHKLGGKMD